MTNAERAQREREITQAIVAGIERARRLGFDKPHDTGIFLRTQLDRAGFQIVRKPHATTTSQENDQ